MGKAGIFGAMGGFRPMEFPKDEKKEILSGILKHRKTLPPLSCTKTARLLQAVAQATADYCGRVKNGFPPTDGELDAQITKMQKTAREICVLMDGLEDQINDPSNRTAMDYLHRAMRRNGSSLMKVKAMMHGLTEFRAHLSFLAEADHRAPEMGHIPEGWADPYMKQFMESLFPVWAQITGKIPGRIVGHYDDQSEKSLENSPFVEWLETIMKTSAVKNALESTGYEPVVSVRLFRKVAATEKERVRWKRKGDDEWFLRLLPNT